MNSDIDHLSALCDLMGVLYTQVCDAVECISEDSPVYDDVCFAESDLKDALDDAFYSFRALKVRLDGDSDMIVSRERIA